jgi:Mor family transcriptional regulator
VYRIVCTATGDVYVGGSANVFNRARNHAYELSCRKHQNPGMHNLVVKHGPGVFKFEMLDTCDVADLSDREKAWIAKLSPSLNVTAGESRNRNPVDMSARRTPIRAQRSRRPKTYSIGPGRQRAADRRNAIVADVVGGMSVEDAAQKHHCSTATVYQSVRTASDKTDRRTDAFGAAVESLRCGNTVFSASIEYGVPRAALYKAAKAAGITLARGRRKGSVCTGGSIVPREKWESLDWTRQDVFLAVELGVSRERVRQVRRLLKKPNAVNHKKPTQNIPVAGGDQHFIGLPSPSAA